MSRKTFIRARVVCIYDMKLENERRFYTRNLALGVFVTKELLAGKSYETCDRTIALNIT